MKKIALFIFLIIINYTLKAQTEKYPKGIYMRFQEVIDKNPSENDTVELEKRTKGKIKMNFFAQNLREVSANLVKNFERKSSFLFDYIQTQLSPVK